MYRTGSLDEEGLLGELSRQEDDLLRAARYGRNLLEKNGKLKDEVDSLRLERSGMEKLLQTQQVEHQRALSAARECAELHVTDVEQQVLSLREELLDSASRLTAAREEQGKLIEELRVENCQLKAETDRIMVEGSTEREELQAKLRRSMEELDDERQKQQRLTADFNKELQERESQASIKTEQVSTLVQTCDRLLDELEQSRQSCEHWEKRCLGSNAELEAKTKEVMDSRELVEELQLQMNQQNLMVLTPDSISSRMSLFDEITSSFDCPLFLDHEDLSSTCSDDLPDYVAATLQQPPAACSHRQSAAAAAKEPPSTQPKVEVEETDVSNGWEASTDVQYQCARCRELQRRVEAQQSDLSATAEQLMTVVRQKFELQLQLEAWQSDMAQIVDENVHRELGKENLGHQAVNKWTVASVKKRQSTPYIKTVPAERKAPGKKHTAGSWLFG